MPFDEMRPLTLTRLEKLERLLWLAERATGKQHLPCECLHHDAASDPVLIASGIPTDFFEDGDIDDWIGSVADADYLFGSQPVVNKVTRLRILIANERAISQSSTAKRT